MGYSALAAYIMQERRKPPEEQEFGPMLDVLPKNVRDFPIQFNDEEMKELEGSLFNQEWIESV